MPAFVADPIWDPPAGPDHYVLAPLHSASLVAVAVLDPGYTSSSGIPKMPSLRPPAIRRRVRVSCLYCRSASLIEADVFKHWMLLKTSFTY